MLHHLYGILERLPTAFRLPETGVGERPVLARRVDGLVVLSTILDATPRLTPCALRRHDDVLAAVAAPGPLFPLRFGVSVPSGELEPWLAAHAGLVRAGLHLVRGRVEMRVSVLALRFGAGDACRLRVVADRVTAAAGLTSWRSRVSGRNGNAAVSLAFLVPRPEVSTFLARIAPVATRAGEVAVVPSGPWPAFTFVPALDAPFPAAAAPVALPYAV